MKIIRINLFQCDISFKFSFHSPHTIRIQSDSIVVELKFDNGISGYGESAPRPYVTGETPSTVTDTIQDFFSKTLFRSKIDSIEDVKSTLAALERECLDNNLKAYNSALGAIDIALLDALGKFEGAPLHHYLGPIVTDKMPCSFSIPFLSVTELTVLSHRVLNLHLDYLKIIMGEVEGENLERVRLMRSLFGEQIGIHIEANGKWSTEQAIAHIEKLKRFNISGVEQPVAASDIEGLNKIRNKTGIPVIVDESMCNLSDAKRLIAAEACDIINIKISKCGGLLKCREIRNFAESKNIRCQVGSHVGETDILGEAGRYFGITTRNIFCFEGFSQLLFEDSWEEHFLKRSSSKDTSLNSGLGVDLAKQKLKLLCSIEADQ
jgi:L-alanine-DL-glutamate epimerase-like enolase superfamily enzyme